MTRAGSAMVLAWAMASTALAQAPGPSETLVKAAQARIAALDHAGPKLNAVIALSPTALAEARTLDAERAAGKVRGPLHGVPILLKDNVEAAGPLPTTAGSLALAANVTGRDAFIVRRLRAAGAVILGKANLSEWANYRSSRSVSGWSAVGGLVRNPYVLDRGACGSSSGSAVAVASGYVIVAIGTETDGSVVCPSSANGVVGLKPTLGLVSRNFIVPLSGEQDSAGPIGRTVRDAAMVLSAIAGSDPADAMTRDADAHHADYLAALDARALRGARIGVLRGSVRASPATDKVFEEALAQLKAAGAVLVEVPRPASPQTDAIGAAEEEALKGEFHAAIDAYLAAAPVGVKARSLQDLVAFDAGTPAETALFGQETFEQALKTSPTAVTEARATVRRLARAALDAMFTEAKVEAVVTETGAPASVVDPVNGAKSLGSPSSLPAVAGYPHLTVPMGQVAGLPVGLSIIGPAWSDARVLALGYAFEQKAQARRDPTFAPRVTAVWPAAARAEDVN